MADQSDNEPTFMSPDRFRLSNADQTYDSDNATMTDNTLADDAFDEDELLHPEGSLSSQTLAPKQASTGVDCAPFLWEFSSAHPQRVEQAEQQPVTPASIDAADLNDEFQTPVRSRRFDKGDPGDASLTVDISATSPSILPDASPVLDPQLRAAVLNDFPETISVRMPDPFSSSDADIVMFGSSKPASAEELGILRSLLPQAAGEVSAEMAAAWDLTAVVSLLRRSFESIRHRDSVISSLRAAELGLTDQALDEERRRHSVVNRRQSMAIGQLIHAKQAEANSAASTLAEQVEYSNRLEEQLEMSDAIFAEYCAIAFDIQPHGVNDETRPSTVLNVIKDELTASKEANAHFNSLSEQYLLIAQDWRPELLNHDIDPADTVDVIAGALNDARDISDKFDSFSEEMQVLAGSIEPDAVHTALDVASTIRIVAKALTRLESCRNICSSSANEGQKMQTVTCAGEPDILQYGERLLHLERREKDLCAQVDNLTAENTLLKLEQVAKEVDLGSLPATPASMSADSPRSRLSFVDRQAGDLQDMREALVTVRSDNISLRERTTRLSAERDDADSRAIKISLEFDAVSTRLTHVKAALAEAERERSSVANEHAALLTRFDKLSKEAAEKAILNAQDQHDAHEARCELENRVKQCEHLLAAERDHVGQLEISVQTLEAELLESNKRLIETRKSTSIRQATRSAMHDETQLSHASPQACDSTLLFETELSQVPMAAKLIDCHECSYWKDLVQSTSVTRATSAQPCFSVDADRGQTIGMPGSSVDAFWASNQESFMRRLSATLGCHGESGSDLVVKLIRRIEELMVERRDHHISIEKLQVDIISRERALRLMRSEFAAEVSALRAELAHVENDRKRVTADREAVEAKLLEIARVGDESTQTFGDDCMRRSLRFDADLTGESNRSQPSRAATYSVMEFDSSAAFHDDEVQWDDSSIQAAVHSVNVLIGNKASLDARNQALKDRLSRAIATGRGVDGGSGGGEARAIVIESRALQEELVVIVAMQQKLIRKLRMVAGPGASRRTSVASSGIGSFGGDFENCISGNDENDSVPHPNIGSSPHRRSLSMGAKTSLEAWQGGINIGRRASKRRQSSACAVEFLREQLLDVRNMCNDRAKSNTHLHSVIREMESEIERVSSEKAASDAKYAEVIVSHATWCERVAQIAGVESSPEDVEKFVSSAVSASETNSKTISQYERRCFTLDSRLGNMLAQKRFLSHIIHLYQAKYQLNILAPVNKSRENVVAKLRRSVSVVIASLRIKTLASGKCEANKQLIFIDVSKRFDVPASTSLVGRDRTTIELVSAAMALSALPRLQTALADREREIGRLNDSIATLHVSSARQFGENVENRVGVENQPAFNYDQDVVDRKNDLARRLRRAQKQKEELSVQIVREKQQRQSSELRVAKYMHKLSSYQQRMGKMKNDADARERTYKAAIRYLKSKADNAIIGDKIDVGNEDTNALLAEAEAVFGQPQADKMSRHASTAAATRTANGIGLPERSDRAIALLEGQIRNAEAELYDLRDDDEKARELRAYVGGLKKASRRLRQNTGPRQEEVSDAQCV
jgi:hypothetical protein